MSVSGQYVPGPRLEVNVPLLRFQNLESKFRNPKWNAMSEGAVLFLLC